MAGLGGAAPARRLGRPVRCGRRPRRHDDVIRTSRCTCATIPQPPRGAVRRAVTSPRSTPAASASSARATPPAPGAQIAARLGRELAEAGVVVVSGLAKGIDGAAHRGALAAGRGRPVAVVGNGPDIAVSTPARRAVGRGVRPWRLALRVAAGNGARGVPLPAAQPHPRRAQRGARRRREPRARRIADHRPGGDRAVDRRDGRSRLGPQPGRGRHQPAAPRRRGARHVRRRRARRPRARHPAGDGARRTTRGRCRAASTPRYSTDAAAIRARSTRSSSTSACRSATRRWRSPASSAPAGCARRAVGSSRCGSGRDRDDQVAP